MIHYRRIDVEWKPAAIRLPTGVDYNRIMSVKHTDNNEAEIFHEGIRQFNDGEWFEAHEVWEDIWHDASGQKKLFYQGLIQFTVTIEHIRRGNPRGVRAVYKTCLTKFEGLTGVYMGIDVDWIRSELKRMVDPILNLPAERFDPALPRGQDLPVDLNTAPLIKLKYDPFKDSSADQASPD